MDFLDVFFNPGALVGCLVGIGAAFLLHWLFPTENLAVVQGLLILLFTCAGITIELVDTKRSKRKQR